MKFVYDEEIDRNSYIGASQVRKHYDPEKKCHVFTLKGEDRKEKEICTLNALTGESIYSDTELSRAEGKEVKWILNHFQESTKIVNGNKDEIRNYLLSKLGNRSGIGFLEEFRISATGPNLNPDDIWWTLKRQRTVPGTRFSMPLFIVRYTVDDDSTGFAAFGEPATPTDLYIRDDGKYDVEELADTIIADIERFDTNLFDFTVEHTPRM